MQGAGIVGKQRSQLLDKDASKVSRTRQCELLGVPRSSSYYVRWHPLLDIKWAFLGQTSGTEGYGVIAFV